jgi:hypothetical protein
LLRENTSSGGAEQGDEQNMAKACFVEHALDSLRRRLAGPRLKASPNAIG